MKSIEDKYLEVVKHLAQLSKNDSIDYKQFDFPNDELREILKALEKDGLINHVKVYFGGELDFCGLTYEGKIFAQNGYRKQEKHMNVVNNYHVNIGRDNNGQVAFGENINFSSEFDKKFIDLIENIQQSQLNDKDNIIEHLQNFKSDKAGLQTYLGTLLTRGAEVSSIIGAITSLLPLLVV